MKKEMLINVLQPEECRIAIVENGVLEELHVERTSQESYVGNIYKGKIVNIEPSIQAAFVDFGIGRNGFLHVSDVDPAYYKHLTSRGERNDRGDRRDRDRGDRGRVRDRGQEEQRPFSPPVAWTLEPPEESADRGGFGAGIWDDDPPPDSSSTVGTAPAEFGTGILDDEPPAVASGEEAETVAEAEAETEAEVEVEEKPEAEEKAESKRPRRSRSRAEAALAGEEESGEAKPKPKRTPSRRRTRAKAEPENAAGDKVEGEPAEPSEPESDKPPRYMDSAERRTSDDDPEIAGPDDEADPIDSFSGHEPGSAPDLDDDSGDDDDLFDMEDEAEEGMSGGDRRRGRGGDRRRSNGGGRRGFTRNGGRPKPLIQDIFKRGQEVIVQVIKEGIGTKGPTLSTYISIAGRYLVLMPGLNRIGVSRKIADDNARARLRDILEELQPPKGLGFIIRTAGVDRNKTELQNDLAYLLRLWQVMVRRIKKLRGPCEIFKESDIITRTIRDTFTSDIDTIWVDEAEAFAHAQEFLQVVMPRFADRIKHYDSPEPLFHHHKVEDEIARIQQKRLELPLGGSIVIEQTEALVAIDVNSGNFRADNNNAEETAYRMNLQAAKEIARQLRLRDLGGVIVNDFIDMREEKHRRGVEKALRDAMARDRARTKILRISQFGIIEMTRQRIRPSLKRSVYMDCPHCRGNGQVKTVESVSIEVMRLIQLAAHREAVARVSIEVQPDVAAYLLNRKRAEIARLEASGEIQVMVTAQFGAAPESLKFVCTDANGNEVRLFAAEPPTRRPPRSYGPPQRV